MSIEKLQLMLQFWENTTFPQKYQPVVAYQKEQITLSLQPNQFNPAKVEELERTYKLFFDISTLKENKVVDNCKDLLVKKCNDAPSLPLPLPLLKERKYDFKNYKNVLIDGSLQKYKNSKIQVHELDCENDHYAMVEVSLGVADISNKSEKIFLFYKLNPYTIELLNIASEKSVEFTKSTEPFIGRVEQYINIDSQKDNNPSDYEVEITNDSAPNLAVKPKGTVIPDQRRALSAVDLNGLLIDDFYNKKIIQANEVFDSEKIIEHEKSKVPDILKEFDLYKNENRILVQAINLLNLKDAIDFIRNMQLMPSEVIIPVVDKRGIFSILHLKLEYMDEKISKCDAMYYTHEKDTINLSADLSSQLSCDITWASVESIPQLDSAYRVYNGICALFNRGEIDEGKDFLTNDETKLLLIKAKLNEYAEYQCAYGAGIVYIALLNADVNNSKIKDAINVLYEILLSESVETLRSLNDFIMLMEDIGSNNYIDWLNLCYTSDYKYRGSIYRIVLNLSDFPISMMVANENFDENKVIAERKNNKAIKIHKITVDKTKYSVVETQEKNKASGSRFVIYLSEKTSNCMVPAFETIKNYYTESNKNDIALLSPDSIIKENKSHHKDATDDIRRLLTAEPLRLMFDETFEENPGVVITSKYMSDKSVAAWFSVYERKGKLLLSPVCVKKDERSILLKVALKDVKKKLSLYGHPQQIIVPIIEKKSGWTRFLSEAQHIKTLHIKDIVYSNNTIISWRADYYDSKGNLNNNVFPSDEVNSIVTGIFGQSAENGWNDINIPYQPLFNRSDCGYWAYIWCCALFNNTNVNLKDHFINENKMKLLYIHRKIKDEVNLSTSDNMQYINSVSALFNLLVKASDGNLKKSAAINILYETVILSKQNHASVNKENSEESFMFNEDDASESEYDLYSDKKYQEQSNLINKTITLFNGTASAAEIEEYLNDAEKYKETSGMQIFVGSMIVLAGLAILGLCFFADILTTGGSATVFTGPIIGEVSVKLLSIIGWYFFGGATTLTGMYNVYKGYSNHNQLVASCEELANVTTPAAMKI